MGKSNNWTVIKCLTDLGRQLFSVRSIYLYSAFVFQVERYFYVLKFCLQQQGLGVSAQHAPQYLNCSGGGGTRDARICVLNISWVWVFCGWGSFTLLLSLISWIWALWTPGACNRPVCAVSWPGFQFWWSLGLGGGVLGPMFKEVTQPVPSWRPASSEFKFPVTLSFLHGSSLSP